MRLYLDANAIIYSIEGALPFRDRALIHIDSAAAKDTGVLLTSLLSRLECRVKPLRDGRTDLLAEYDAFLSATHVELIEISASIIELATGLRSRYRFTTPDALHLATAIEHHADLFLTGDAKLGRCREVRVEVI